MRSTSVMATARVVLAMLGVSLTTQGCMMVMIGANYDLQTGDITPTLYGRDICDYDDITAISGLCDDPKPSDQRG